MNIRHLALDWNNSSQKNLTMTNRMSLKCFTHANLLVARPYYGAHIKKIHYHLDTLMTFAHFISKNWKLSFKYNR